MTDRRRDPTKRDVEKWLNDLEASAGSDQDQDGDRLKLPPLNAGEKSAELGDGLTPAQREAIDRLCPSAEDDPYGHDPLKESLEQVRQQFADEEDAEDGGRK